MPQMTGFELALKMKKIRQDIPVIISSGYIDKDVEDKIQDAGINAFVKKPVTRSDIALVLRHVFEQSGAV